MKIAIVGRHPSFLIGGAEKVNWDLGLAMAREGWDIVYFSLAPPPEIDIPHVPRVSYRFIPLRASLGLSSYISYFSRTAYLEYKKLIREESPNLVIDSVSPIPFYPMHFFDRSTPKALYVHAIFRKEGFEFMNKFFGILIFLHEGLYRFLEDMPIIVDGKSTEERVKELMGNKRVYILNPSVRCENYTPKIVKDNTYALCLTRLDYRKDVETLLKAWKILNVDITLKIAGDGPKKESLVKSKEELRLPNVKFLGRVSEEEKIRLYRDACLYILPTWFEGYGISILEAMASGTPVISCDTFGVRDIIINCENGFLVHPNNPPELAEKISILLKNKDLRVKFAQNGIETAKRHDFSHFIYKSKDIIIDILKKFSGD